MTSAGIADGEPTQPLDLPQKPQAVQHAAQAVAALHAASILHRDVKPDNILLYPGGAKLSDLGLSQVFMPGMTVTGMGSITSVEYTDPDQLRGEPAGPHNDVWSLGVVLHRVAAGTGVYGELPAGDGLLALRWMLSTKPIGSAGLPEPLAREAVM